MQRLMALIAAALAALSLASTPAQAHARSHQGCPLPRFGVGAAYRPRIRPDRFVADVDNPWFPLKPDTTYVYAGTKDGEKAIDVVAISHKTRVVDGVRTRVVNDRLYLNGVLAERTSDYYAQDRCGNVWYFGEDTADLDSHGHVVSRDGSFHAGVDGAQPGVFMQAHPQLGRWFRQEWSSGQAEDQFAAISKTANVTVPFGTYRHALRTQETSALEPGVVDNKVYVRGIGQLLELAVTGPVETLSLVDRLT